MTIQQFTNQEFDDQKVNRHEIRQVLRGVRQLTPEAWAEGRRQRAEGRNGQTVGEATECPASTLP